MRRMRIIRSSAALLLIAAIASAEEPAAEAQATLAAAFRLTAPGPIRQGAGRRCKDRANQISPSLEAIVRPDKASQRSV